MESGIIIIDKPVNVTSAAVVNRIKHLLKVKKTGHAGTLDPFATGVLICCINKATKLSSFLLSGMKKYEAVICLGVETDTHDSTGHITVQNALRSFSDSEIKAAVKQFIGSIKQIPPVYSALKHRGVPLYKLARAGKPVVKSARKVIVEYIKIIDINFPYVRFETSCSGGTYIRTLGANIGTVLGCGAHVCELRRLSCSGLDIKDAISLEKLENRVLAGRTRECIIDIEDALRHLSKFKADIKKPR
mmetsp:Transcript_493/g.337  ORF Transcript_493/g.337 Transcript_493/m.337 type:complete len:246 (-) Transcript_493:782-1519(-)